MITCLACGTELFRNFKVGRNPRYCNDLCKDRYYRKKTLKPKVQVIESPVKDDAKFIYDFITKEGNGMLRYKGGYYLALSGEFREAHLDPVEAIRLVLAHQSSTIV